MKPFFESSAIEQADHILDIIHQRKEQRKPLFPEQSATENRFQDLRWKLSEVEENHNPIPVPQNTRLRFLKRLVGKLIRTYTRTQVNFNAATSAYLSLVAKHLNGIDQRIIGVEASSQFRIDNMEARLNVLYNVLLESSSLNTESLRADIERHRSKLEKVEWPVSSAPTAGDHQLEHFTAELERLNGWLESLETSHKGLNDWVSSVSKRTEDLQAFQDRTRKELFFELERNTTTSKTQVSEPMGSRIINEDKYKRILESGELKANIGCGTLVKHDYINVDARDLDGVDVVADVRNLPFKNEQLSELYLAHLIEHFTETEMENEVLPYWYSKIKPGGLIRVICPNWVAMIHGYHEGDISFTTLREVTFGSQEYSGNYHFNMFSPDSLRHMLEKVGFVNVTTVAEERVNGHCLEMELVGERPQ